MKSLRIFILLIICSTPYADDKNIESLYKQNNIKGSIIIASLDGNTRYQHNINAKEKFVPASTFKIPNTLIILEEDLIKDQQATIKWDGQRREHSPWNKDQTLKSAFQTSCVWCYQRYAKKIGDVKYRAYLQQFEYGNALTGADITRFWLDGDLRVSVKDQIDFLRKVYSEDLPIKKRHIRTLKDIMLSAEHEEYKVWPKTGWSGKDGWYIGYLTRDDQVWFFANHIEIHENSDLVFRKKLTMEAFKMLKIIQTE